MWQPSVRSPDNRVGKHSQPKNSQTKNTTTPFIRSPATRRGKTFNPDPTETQAFDSGFEFASELLPSILMSGGAPFAFKGADCCWVLLSVLILGVDVGRCCWC
jgi:hypothetical protein